ncbi:MFS transporter [Devosia sediminis]|uniref:MFS transporter n=1 Tax=Devosia sediminis TaxID=2798801 RepID=A0A934IXT5_9HYPH|nr:MFS transporter [Devosia sediminis]MBJ3784205.1 MFS transporter [Devosia sediminis]
MTSDAAAPSYKALLGLKPARRLALASVPADFSDWLDYAAVIALVVFAWGEGPYVMALLALALSLPYVVVGPFLAVIVDHAPIRTVLVISNLGRGLATLAFAFVDQTFVLLALVFLRGCIDSAFTPARQAAIQATTPEALRGHANGLHQAINQTSKIAGPAIGGLLLAVWQPQQVFLFNAVLSGVAMLLAATVIVPTRPVSDAPKGKFLTESLKGIAEFRRSTKLLIALIFSSCAYFAFFLYDALIALLADGFGFDATVFGFSIAASGFGGLIGALVAGRVAERRPILTMSLAAMVSGTTTALLASAALLGWPVQVAAFLLVLGFMGGATAFMLVPYRTIVQREAPPDRIARVFATGEAVIVGSMLSAPLIGSVIASQWGTPAAFLAGGVMLVLLGVVTLASVLRP